ncbi:fatty acyl-CoA reductase 1 [Striga asiatica]|uniref:Fatty acyl-CoA reductase 1 n=1 Tax=Striga asiatica TaxID=4170 RepID=A0A5A7QBX7_STRAF|nr:fatty acyl-CoA reductase 1 [Striga asiatica]
MEISVLKESYKAEAINRWRLKICSTTYRDSYIANHVDTTPTHAKRHKSNDASSSNKIIKTTSRTCKDGRSLLEKVPLEPTILPAQPPCIYCRAKQIHHESINVCCKNGIVSLPNTLAPDILKELFASNTEEAKLFRTCIRTIDNHFAFTSMGVKYDKKKLSRRNKGIYTFKIQGHMYHFVEDLECSKHLQLYFHDTNDQIAKRLEECPRLTESISKKIITLLKDNAYAKFFRRLSEMENLDNYNIVLRNMSGVDQRVFNKPDVSQVAALWVEVSADCIDSADELLNREQEALRASSNQVEFVLVREYYAYKLQMRDLETSLFMSGRLLQHYIVDMYVKLESQRLFS